MSTFKQATYLNLITLAKDGYRNYRVLWASNSKDIGEIYKEVDGYYVYQPNKESGCFSAISLRAIAEHLEDLNEEWAEECDKAFAKMVKT